jgi:hypothetical protein
VTEEVVQPDTTTFKAGVWKKVDRVAYQIELDCASSKLNFLKL